MKILFITTCYPSDELPQYCIFLEQQAQALIKKGVKTDVLLLCQGEETATQEVLRNGVKVTKVGISKNTKKDVFLPTHLSKSDVKRIESAVGTEYDAVSVHFGGLKILRSILRICRRKKMRMIVHFHGLNVWYEFYEKRKWLYNYYRLQKKIVYPKIDAMVGVSDKVTDRFSEKIKNVPAFTVYNGVNLDLFKFREREFVKDGKIKALIVANLIELKGHNYLFKAVAESVKKGIDVELTVAGRGPLEEKLKALSEKLGISDRVRYTGYIEYEKISELMEENDVFIMPSYYEALGCVYLEAMSSGMITVGVLGQGIDEIIKDGENGFLMNAKSTAAILDVIEKIKNSPKKELELISKAATKTAGEYSWDNSAASLYRVYKNAEEKK